jgi:regulator of protease activity HflC (stomatin/prohibitin superfamily)
MEWIGKLLEAIRDLFPALFMVEPSEGGIRLTLGKYVKTLKPGWYIYWPVIQYCGSVDVVPQVVDLRPQSCLTADMKDVVISGGVKYRVSDARKAMLCVADYDKDIQVMSLGIIADFISRHPFGVINKFDELADIILVGIREEAAGMGLKIMKVYITDIGTNKNVRMMGDVSYGTAVEEV